MDSLLTQLRKMYVKLGGSESDIPPAKLNDLEYIVDKVEDKFAEGSSGGSGGIEYITVHPDETDPESYYLDVTYNDIKNITLQGKYVIAILNEVFSDDNSMNGYYPLQSIGTYSSEGVMAYTVTFGANQMTFQALSPDDILERKDQK